MKRLRLVRSFSIAAIVLLAATGAFLTYLLHLNDMHDTFGPLRGHYVEIGILALVFLLMAYIVVRAEGLVFKKALQIEESNLLLDQRVSERTHELNEGKRALKASEDRFRALTAMSSDFYWETDAEHRFILRTLSARETASGAFDPSSFIGITRWEVPHSSPDNSVWEDHRSLLDAHRPFRNFEITRLGKHGEAMYISVSGDPVFDEAGQFLGYRGTGTDITERKKAEIELGIAAVAFESMQSMLITDAKGIIQRVNQAFVRSTGFSPADLLGKTPSVLQSGKHSRSFYASMWQSLLEKGHWEGEIWGKRKNGELYPKWLSIFSVRNAAGQVAYYVATYLDLSERKHAEQMIERLVYYDLLTDLPNRSLLIDRMSEFLGEALRKGTHGAVVKVDLDNMKAINEVEGFQYGDRILQLVSQRLQAWLLERGMVARVGGDEFVLVIADLARDALAAATERAEIIARELLAELALPYSLPQTNGSYRCTASLGVTVFDGRETSVRNLLRQAEIAAHQSKQAGGNVCNLFSSTMEALALEHVRIEVDLRSALETGQFVLFYQPQVSGATGEILGAEALIRWQHPERGLVMPGAFIYHLERTGLMAAVGLWVIEAACRQLVAWSDDALLSRLVLSVNLSAQQFRADDFVEQIAAVLAHTGITPARLKLELTESVFAGDTDMIIDKMNRLRALGLGFSLDDFGTGYSSLSYLSRMPFDQLKIDRSFVAGIDDGSDNVTICSATIGLARSLKLKVVAEGVETESQRYYLGTVHQCDMLQGYLFGKPLPLEDFERLCRSAKPLPG